MNPAALVALAATFGNMLQGWDNATIAGALVYIKKELALGSTVEGLVVAMSLIGATLITTCSGTISDWVGRRPMLILSSIFYFVSGFVMLWSPNVYILLLARLLDGFGVGLAVTLVPLYISETAPADIRGLLNTLPQFTGCAGMFMAYCMVFGMSLMDSPNWRLMLGVLLIPSLLYFSLAVLYLPESPRWLVSKGRMREAKEVLRKLRGREDVSVEMALLVEGLDVGGDTSIEEYMIVPGNELKDDQEPCGEKDHIKLYGREAGQSWVAKPVTGQSSIGLVSRNGSIINRSTPLVDPLVTLFGSVHEKQPELGSMRSMLFPNFGSMFSTADSHVKHEQWDEEALQHEGEDYASNSDGDDSDNNLQSPLLSRQATSMEKSIAHGSATNVRRHSSLMQGNVGEEGSSMGIGGGWQLAWRWSEREGEDGKKEGSLKRIYLHQEGIPGTRRGSLLSVNGGDVPADGDLIPAAALVSQNALHSKGLMDQHTVGPAMVHPSETASKAPSWAALVSQNALHSKGLMDQHTVGPAMVHPSETASKAPSWAALLEPGVSRALIVGIGIQLLQQFSGINGVMYYTPQILEQAGVGVLLSSLGIGSVSASFLISAFTTLLMLPSIAVAMRFVDVAGRRALLLMTIPVLILSLIILVITNVFNFGTVLHAIVSTICVIVYFCCFVMGYGPIPNILCSEIFPTRVRGLCIAICALVYWLCNIVVTYTLPVMLTSIGLAGAFGIYAVACVMSWIFVYIKIPETKGMPLEVITEFFAVGAKKIDAAKRV